MGTPKQQFQIVPTPNPNERGFYTELDQEALSELRDGDWPVDEETLYRNWRFAIPERKTQWGAYIYVGQEVGSAPGTIRFLWLKNKTDEEKNTPYKTYREFKNHHWDPILLGVKVEQDYNFPVSSTTISGAEPAIVTAPRNYIKRAIIPDVDEGSIVVTEEFFAATPFDIPRYPVPTPTAVNIDFYDTGLSVPRCLHPKIEVPDIRSGIDIYLTTSQVASEANGAISGQLFPATNFETWAPYVVSDQQARRDGGWYRKRIRVYPPDMPDAIIS